MSLATTISNEDRQALWFEFAKAVMHKRILYKGNLVTKFEVFATFLNKNVTITDFTYDISKILTNSSPNYHIVWKWELLSYKTNMNQINNSPDKAL